MNNISDKQELLSNVRLSRNLVGEFNKFQSQIYSLVNAKRKITEFIWYYPIWAIIATPFLFFAALIALLFKGPLSNILTVLMIISAVSGILVHLIKKFIVKAIQSHNLKQKCPEINRLKQEAGKYITELQRVSIIPQRYWSIHALNCFESYLLNMQADSLKECINIYEQQLQHMQRMDELRNIQYNLNNVQASIENLNRNIGEVNSSVVFGNFMRK